MLQYFKICEPFDGAAHEAHAPCCRIEFDRKARSEALWRSP